MATADHITVARPYAKAAFETAIDEQKVAEWALALAFFSMVCKNQQVTHLLKNPLIASEKVAQFFIEMGSEHLHDSIRNLVLLLAQNKRLLIFPEIASLFETHRAEYEKTIDVKVLSFMPLTDSQSASIKQSLEKRLSRKVSLNNKIDKELLGGAIIYAGDLVLDGSVRGKLNKLASDIIA